MDPSFFPHYNARPTDPLSSPGMQDASASRILWIDGLRGLTILSMIGYHALWDAVHRYGFACPWFDGAGAYLWQQSICWTFILLSGLCWPFSRSPLKRGLQVFAMGLVVSIVTWLFARDSFILFGVLTFIGSAMLLMIPLDKGLKRLSLPAGLGLSALGFFLTRDVSRGALGFETLKLVKLPSFLYADIATAFWGFPPKGFQSADYFPLIPWLFLFVLGYFLNRCLKPAAASPSWDAPPLRFLRFMGRHALLIYLLHQPVITLLFTLFAAS